MKRKIKTVVAIALSFIFLVSCSRPATEVTQAEPVSTDKEDSANTVPGSKQEESRKIEAKTVPFYIGYIDRKESINLYYVDDSTVPYISLDTIMIFLGYIADEEDYEKHLQDYELNYSGDHAVFTRIGTKLTCDFDFSENTITFYDYDAFLKRNAGPIVNIGVPDSDPVAPLFQEVEKYSYDKYGKVMVFDLKPYEIALVHEGDGYYIPLQTASDLFLTYNIDFALFNGEAVFLIPGELDEECAEIYYSAKGTRTEEFARFDYNELCFALDHLYGLKEMHDITSFDDYIFQCGLRNKFLSTDQTDADVALSKFIAYQLDDLHSGINNMSYMSDKESFSSQTKDIRGPSSARFLNNYVNFTSIREAAFPDGVPPYEEIGDTAYITFDEFSPSEYDMDYMAEPKEEELYDTIRLIQYSRDKILRPDSPVKNVVLDLSLNTGGAVISAAYVTAFFMGTGDISAVNSMTGAAGVAAYNIDTDRDGKFTQEDYLAEKGLNLYCLISPISFSCGNLLPNTFSMSPEISLLGMTSGGGSCAVQPLTTAGGCVFQISGPSRLSVLQNGSFYSIDRGATPDYHITKMSNYYDREYLTKWINSLP